MPRDWMDHPRGREPRGEGRAPQARATERDDFGQADFSRDYAYDPESRTAYRPAEEAAWRRDDYGQADYSDDYGYDRARGQGYRRFSDGDRDYDRAADASDAPSGRSWMGRAGAFLNRRNEAPARRRRGPSDRVLWTVIVERLEDERGLDLRDVEILVENAEVTLNGVVRRKIDKRRIEDIADIEGVRHVQNNLRVHPRWI